MFLTDHEMIMELEDEMEIINTKNENQPDVWKKTITNTFVVFCLTYAYFLYVNKNACKNFIVIIS